MNDPGTFDELARRKLEERTFSFDEEHWTELQRGLSHGRNGRRAGWLWLSAALLLLISGTTLVLLMHDDERGPLVEARTGLQVPASTPVTTTVDRIHDGEEPDRVTARPSGTESADGIHSPGHANTPLEPNKELKALSELRTAVSQPEKTADRVQVGVSASDKAASRKQEVRSRRNGADRAKEDGVGAQDHHRNINMTVRSGAAPTLNARDALNATPNDDLHAGSDPGAEQALQPSLASGSGTTASNEGTQDSSSVQPASTDTTDPNDEAITLPTTVTQHTPSATTMGETTDPLRSSVTSDSLTAPVPDNTTLAMREPHAWALELSFMGGALNTRSGFTPTAALDSRSQVSGAWGSTLGGELMLQWPHFGIGTGLHYTTLAERINSERLATSFTSINYHFSVQSIDTTIIVVTGTVVQDTITYYITAQKDTVLNVLTIDRDTMTTEVQKRAAKETRNTVSYLEIPLLLDARTHMGRFTFGVRGGPTLGLIQVSQGFVPNSTEDGYADLRPRSFRETVLGYQARLYVRYRLTTKLSLGLEPFIRGAMQDLFVGDIPSGRPTSWGGALSLTWRF